MAKAEIQKLYEQVLPYLTIDVNNLGAELVKHTASYAYLSQELARAKGRVADKKNSLDYSKAVAFIEAKGGTFEDGTGKATAVTETLAKSYVDAAESVMAAKAELAEAEKILAFWQSILDAMYQRSYMLTKLVDMQQHELLLAGNEYNANLKQQLYKEVTEEQYEKATDMARQAKRKSQIASMKDVVKKG